MPGPKATAQGFQIFHVLRDLTWTHFPKLRWPRGFSGSDAWTRVDLFESLVRDRFKELSKFI